MVAPLPVLEPAGPAPPLPPPKSALVWNTAALVVALAAAAGSLWLSLGMDLWACPLCYYQRAFVLGTAAVLLMAQLTSERGSASISVLAMPLAVAGLGIAGWHVSRELLGKMECPAGLFGLGTAPQQSLAAHVLLFIFLAIGGIRRPALAVAVVLGGLLAYACLASVAPMKPPPPEDAPKICHPPLPPAG
jgi:disulfide bond formation protein DsbB